MAKGIGNLLDIMCTHAFILFFEAVFWLYAIQIQFPSIFKTVPCAIVKIPVICMYKQDKDICDFTEECGKPIV